MIRTSSLLLLAFLGSCATGADLPESALATPPSHSGTLPLAPGERDEGAPNELCLPTGVGMTVGPTSFLFGTTLDIPIDKQITFGPSLLYGIDDDIDIMSLTGQLKYFLPVIKKETGSFSLLPYVTAGAGVVQVDKKGGSSDSGLALNGGFGVRYLTGEHFRIGSEARLNFMPDEVAGEEFFLSLELLQIVITF